MAMVANDPAAAKRMGIPQSVGSEFMKADKGRRFGSGSRADVQSINKPKTNQGKQEFFSKGGDMKESKSMMKKEVGFMKKAGAPKSMIKHEMKEAGMKKMANGGITTAKMGAVRTAAPSKDGLAAKGKTKGAMVKMAGSKPLGMKYGGKC
ncbi:hypothetical protein EBT31_02145 [bacterium]|nr:hypothetical protein [bacterium]